MQIDPKVTKRSRDDIFNALVAEGVPGLMNGFANLHLLPIFQNKIAYGKKGFPWNSEFVETSPCYEKGICPIAEELQERTFLGLQMCMFDFNSERIEDIVKAFKKVWKYYVD